MKTVFFLLLLAFSSSSKAQSTQSNSATVYFMNSVGARLSVYIDENRVCKLREDAYSVHQVSPGLHKMQVTGFGHEPKDRIYKLEIDMKAGETYYFSLIPGEAKFSYVLLMEVTVNTANMKLKSLKQTDCK